ncbi:MAG: penicillin acylase family protein, partial [Polyangiales bacterium]
MRRIALGFLVLGIFTSGCDDDSGGTGGTPGNLEWPPEASVYFDEHGIFNADCSTDEDCAMALGYYHAFDRFVQMDIRRRFSTGRLADLLLPGLAPFFVDDFADLRALFSTREGQPAEEFLYAQASPKTKALLDAYAVGVNQWISDMKNGENGATFPREFSHPLLSYTPEAVPAWTPQDSVAAVLALIENLTNDESVEVAAGNARALINDDSKFTDLWSRRPLAESAILPLDWTPPAPTAAAKRLASARSARPNSASVIRRLHEKLERTIDLRRLILGLDRSDGEIGSNNWVVGPSLTTSGNALLSNDPHLGMTQPATWYLAHLDAKTHGNGEIHSAGVTFAAVPWVLIGQNESIAWGMTTTYMDFTDVYVETLVKDSSGNPTGVMFKGAEVPFTRVPFTVTFSDGNSEQRELLFVPHHGAVREIDAANGTALTLRWTGNDADSDINFLTELVRSTTVDEARVALQNITSVGQNVVVMDSENNIGWFPYNRLPKRTWATNLAGDAPSWLPLDGSGDYEWDTYFDLVELPQAYNPASGYVATANNDMTGALFDGDPTTLFDGQSHPPYQVDAAAGFRHAQIVKLIEGMGSNHTRQTMDAIVSDVYSL